MGKRLAATIFLLLFIAGPAFASSDPFFDQQWGLKKVKAESAWGTGQGDRITIAIIDTGVDRTHIDLSGNVVAGYDFVDNDSNPHDETSGPGEDCPGNPGHGTHVAGIAAAIANNSYGIAGVAPKARIMPIRVLNKYGCGSLKNISAGVDWAVRNGAHIVNLSLGEDAIDRNLFGPALEQSVNDAWSRGVIPVVAGGNDRLFPSGYSSVNAIVVGATDQNDQKASFSNLSESKWAITAPGSSIISTLPGQRFGSFSGTSMATPHVAGGAAILRCLGQSPDQTRDRLLSKSDDLGPAGPDPVYGHGRLNVEKAVSGLSGCSAPASTEGAGGQTTNPAAPRSGSSRGSAPKAESPPARSEPQPQEETPAPADEAEASDEGEEPVAMDPLDESDSDGLSWFLIGPALALLGAGSFLGTKYLIAKVAK